MTARVGRVVLSPAAATTIRDEAARSDDGNETGGLLLGHIEPTGTAQVRYAGGPGPAAVRRPAFFLRDLHHAQRVAADAFARDRSMWIGEWHTHPRAAPTPSDQDLRTYLGFLDDPELGLDAFITIILTSRTGAWDRPEAHAWICYRHAAEHVPLILAPHKHSAPADPNTPLPTTRTRP
ncbi:Mov34/MPN/PAD-1 family protein [Micromonospora sp. DR5-3]|uniref:Mov34/MPN/PAD-1 family protein n=1 Tax=unclassified Micromonospora TaxID=2617518 RepID=UPI001CA30369|nr:MULTISPECIES: Mov34/MPN/PAD-1 family protein [unclassified Micromonospora]MCW3814450.1 Mov34/MPN/PAD-1 family protein [Micromonospora sp. DR5-3]